LPIIVGRLVQEMSRYGGLSIEGVRIVGFFEKGMLGPGIINAGVYLFPIDFLKKFLGV